MQLSLGATDVLMGAAAAVPGAGIEVGFCISGYTQQLYPSDGGASAAATAAAALAAAALSAASPIGAAASKAGLGTTAMGLAPTVMQQITATIINSGSGRRRGLRQSGSPPAPVPPAALSDFVASGGLNTALAAQPGGGNITVLPGGRAAAVKHMSDLKRLRAELSTLISITQLHDDAAALKRNLPLLALVAALPLGVGCVCQMQWQKRVAAEQAARAEAEGGRDVALRELQKVRLRQSALASQSGLGGPSDKPLSPSPRPAAAPQTKAELVEANMRAFAAARAVAGTPGYAVRPMAGGSEGIEWEMRGTKASKEGGPRAVVYA